jgi:hypothetical protein
MNDAHHLSSFVMGKTVSFAGHGSYTRKYLTVSARPFSKLNEQSQSRFFLALVVSEKFRMTSPRRFSPKITFGT